MKIHQMKEPDYGDRYREKLKSDVGGRSSELEDVHKELLKKNTELSTLLSVTRSLLKSTDIDELLDKTLEGAISLVPSEAGALLLINPNSGLIELAFFHNIESLPIPDIPHIPEQLHFGFDDSYISLDAPRVKHLTGLLSLSNLFNSERDYNFENGLSERLKGFLSVPLKGMEGILGVIYLINKLDGEYTEEDARFLLAFSSEAAVTIENFRMHSSLLEKEKEVQKQRRLAAIGEMSAQIAHEIRNPLQKILTGVEYLRDYHESKNRTVIGIISNGVSSINKIISKMVEYGRPSALNLQDVDAREVLEDVLSSIHNRLNLSKIIVVRDFPGKAIASFDPARFRQALQNIMDNAIDAMPEGGKLKIAMRFICEEKKKPTKTACVQVTSSSRLEIKISDTGVGMEKEAMEKLFTPFYTTKVNNSGLGLAMAKKIIDLHKGEISVKSRAGSGTEVAIRMPIQTVP